jgi:hypothetical protein
LGRLHQVLGTVRPAGRCRAGSAQCRQGVKYLNRKGNRRGRCGSGLVSLSGAGRAPSVWAAQQSVPAGGYDRERELLAVTGNPEQASYHQDGWRGELQREPGRGLSGGWAAAEQYYSWAD